MNLLEIRTQAVNQSGRYDLVTDTTTYADNGMDFHILAGQKWLNRKSGLSRAFAHLSNTLSSDSYYQELANKFKELQSVTVADGTTSWSLTHKTLAELKDLYEADPTAAPAYYAYASYRTLETASSLTIANFIALAWPADTDDKYDFSGIIVVPAADTDYTLTVGGEFLPLEMSDNADENFWSEEYPNILVLAALRSIALLDSNKPKADALEEIILAEISQLGFFTYADNDVSLAGNA
jgi:hypothetical protein